MSKKRIFEMLIRVNRLYLDPNAAIMSGAEHLPSGPLVRGDPFTQLPLDHQHKNLLVGREEIVTPLASQMINGTPGIHLIVGESGSGRTSIIQCLSSPDSRHVGTIWHPTDPTSRFLNEALVGFTHGFKIPPTPQAAANQLTNYLNDIQGPLPLIAFDYNTPNSQELMALIKELLPVLRRMRAMVVFAISPNQMEGWDRSLHDSFDMIHYLDALNLGQVRQLIDNRMGTVSNETIVTDSTELTKLQAFSRGNPSVIIRQLSKHLRHLRYPENGSPPQFLAIDVSTFPDISESESPNREIFSATPQQIPSPAPQRPLFTTPSPSSPPQSDGEYNAWLQGTTIETESTFEPIPAPNNDFEPIVDSLMLDDSDSMDSEVGWDDEGVHFASSGGIDDFEGDPLYLETEEEPVQVEPFAEWDKSENEDVKETFSSIPETEITSSLSDSNDYFELIEDEPLPLSLESQINHTIVEPPSPPPPKRGGLFGVHSRSKNIAARIDANLPPNPPTSQIMGIDPLPIPKIIDPRSPKESLPSFVESIDTSSPSPQISNHIGADPMVSRPPDLTSDGADLWVQAGSESPIPKSLSPVVNPQPTSVHVASPEDIVRGLNSLRSPRWDPDAPLRPERLKDVSDADVIILTAATTRDISPSDDALRARLQVGRSRLSQIFNDLRRHGFLSVRKEGRTRWYRMTAAASRLLTEVEE
tara:strand:- start:14204 stop:16303 length:2100 start_codon:yes stop_codon:yes gene_type:complete